MFTMPTGRQRFAGAGIRGMGATASRSRRVAVPRPGAGEVAAISGARHGGCHEPVNEKGAGCPVHFMVHRVRVARDHPMS